MDLTNPVLNADRPDQDVVRVGHGHHLVVSGFDRAVGLGSPEGHDHVTFGAVAVDLTGAEEVAA